jgi:nitrosocyanin
MLKNYLPMTFILLILLITGCTTITPSSSLVNEFPNETTSNFNNEDVVEINVVSYRYGFEPSTIIVNNGDIVRLVGETADNDHGLAISEYGINLLMLEGEIGTVEFTADKSGTFDMYCSVSCGTGHLGMLGTFIVEEEL